MPLIHRKVPWTRQPDVFVKPDVNGVFSDPLFCFLCNTTVPLNLGSVPTQLSETGTPGSLSLATFGKNKYLNWYYGGDGASSANTLTGVDVPANSDFSVIVSFYYDQFLNTGSTGNALLEYNSAGWIGQASSGITFVSTTNNGTPINSISVAHEFVELCNILVAPQTENTIAFTRDSLGNARVFFNGFLVWSGTGLTAELPFSNRSVRILGENGNGRSFKGGVSLFAANNKTGESDYFCKLTANPWLIFSHRVQRLPVGSVSATPTLGTPTFVPGTFTRTGFQPRYSLTF